MFKSNICFYITIMNANIFQCKDHHPVHLWPKLLENLKFCAAKSGTLTLIKYSVRNIRYPKVIKLQFASPLD